MGQYRGLYISKYHIELVKNIHHHFPKFMFWYSDCFFVWPAVYNSKIKTKTTRKYSLQAAISGFLAFVTWMTYALSKWLMLRCLITSVLIVCTSDHFFSLHLCSYEGTGRSLSLKLIQQLRQQSADSQQSISAENRTTNTARLAAGKYCSLVF